jgi:hypothetical protein
MSVLRRAHGTTAWSPRSTSADPIGDPFPVGFVAPFLHRAIAAMAVAVLAVRVSFGPDLTPGLFVSVLLLPVWLPCLKRFWGARLLVGGLVCALASGYLLATLASGHQILSNAQLNTTVLILTLIGGIGVVLWSRTYLSSGQVGCSFGAGLIGNALIGGSSDLAAGNPLKFVWAIPVTVSVLAVAAATRSRVLDLSILLLLCAALTVVDARALFAVCFLSLIVVGWQLRRRRTSRRTAWVMTAVLISGLAFAIYQLSTALVLDGVLGADAQARSVAQIEASGSLLLGGRPELGATIALMGHRPLGFGSGVVADGGDIAAGKAGMASVGYDPNNGYVDHFMFGGKVELHSVFGDLWASFGVVGLLVAVLVGLLTILGIAGRIAQRTASALQLVLGFYALWNILFSPIFGSTPLLVITLGLLLTVRTTTTSTPGSQSTPDATKPPAANGRARPLRPVAGAAR